MDQKGTAKGPAGNTQDNSQEKHRASEVLWLNRANEIIDSKLSVEDTLQQLCMIFPYAWTYPGYAKARIKYAGNTFASPDFFKTPWCQSQGFETNDNKSGLIEICYMVEMPPMDEGPFTIDERLIINEIANIVKSFLDSRLTGVRKSDKAQTRSGSESNLIRSSARPVLLRDFLKRQNFYRNILLDLMPFKVREILIVATLYDAHVIEKEGRFFERILGEFATLNLTTIPRITGVSSAEEALEELRTRHFDLVIMMMGLERNVVLQMGHLIKSQFPYIPLYLLSNLSRYSAFMQEDGNPVPPIDRVFVWNGETRIFFTMIKMVEDKVNMVSDTEIGQVRVILLVEDSVKYYSRYLPVLYSIIFEQIKFILEDSSSDEIYRILRLRVRPKVILATNYEEAVAVLDEYGDHLLAIISDVEFPREGKVSTNAGPDLVKYARAKHKDLSIILQSSEAENEKIAKCLHTAFINKNSDHLNQELRDFFLNYLGFGSFIFRDGNGNQIAVAITIQEFDKHLQNVPDESILYHAVHDHFSLWLMARGEIEVANIVRPKKISDFRSPKEIHQYLLKTIKQHRYQQTAGKVVAFEDADLNDKSNIIRLISGSLGGKGRGLAFVHNLIFNFDFSEFVFGINIKVPWTAIIGTDEYEKFLQTNDLIPRVFEEKDTEKVKALFVNSNLSEELSEKLWKVIEVQRKPLAVRSSGLFEDSLNQPFAGIFDTYILPNNHTDPAVRHRQLSDAIKLVFSSVFSDKARAYVEAINYKIEEEKMAIVLQELVGSRHEDYYYPHISGVAQSYNYYPYAHMQPEEGIAVLAFGLGKHVVEGEKSFRCSPKYPDTEINSPKDQFKNSQVSFFAVNLKEHSPNLLEGESAGLSRLDIYEGEKHGALKHLASVYDTQNQQIIAGLTHQGPRIINFANVLKHNYIPLAKTLQIILDVVKEAMGSMVEIEFAVDMNKDSNNRASFYLLQIKPYIGADESFTLNVDEIDHEHLLLYCEKSMGNGQIDNVQDVLYVDPATFDKSDTLKMVEEIEAMNRELVKEGRSYVLIGPGRWGTRDRWIGIPVSWPQISNAKIIVETDLEDYPLDASSGSHFFHNVTSMNVGYLSVYRAKPGNVLNDNLITAAELVRESKYIRNYRFPMPLRIVMDGKKRIAAITWTP
jgi:hypothetical protein